MCIDSWGTSLVAPGLGSDNGGVTDERDSPKPEGPYPGDAEGSRRVAPWADARIGTTSRPIRGVLIGLLLSLPIWLLLGWLLSLFLRARP
jgi:hypothetical protein